MVKIDWQEFKEFKKHTHKVDKLQIVIDFIKSYYNIFHPTDVYDILSVDDIGQLLLAKRDIINAEMLEDFIFKS